MIISKTATIKWAGSNKQYYIDKGYKFTKLFDGLEVKIEDLQISSSSKIICACDMCDSENEITYNNYIRHLVNGKHYCHGCGRLIKNYINKETLPFTNPKIFELAKDKEKAKYRTINSINKLEFICPVCKKEFIISPKELSKKKTIACSSCSDGTSYNNRFMSQILNQLNIDYITEFTDNWTCGKRYDFYFIYEDRKILLELDGRQHFQNTNWSDYDTVHTNDLIKDKLAIENGYELFRIDCSDNRNVEENIINSLKEKFPNLNYDFDLKECIEKSRDSLKLKVWKMFNSGSSFQEIKNELKCSKSYLIKTIIQGGNAKIINYDPHNLLLKEEVYKLWEEGHVGNYIKEKLKINPTTFARYLKEKYISTNDNLYNISQKNNSYIKCVEDNVIYLFSYLKTIMPTKSIYLAIKNNKPYNNKHYIRLSRQQAYIEQRKTGIKIIDQ